MVMEQLGMPQHMPVYATEPGALALRFLGFGTDGVLDPVVARASLSKLAGIGHLDHDAAQSTVQLELLQLRLAEEQRQRAEAERLLIESNAAADLLRTQLLAAHAAIAQAAERETALLTEARLRAAEIKALEERFAAMEQRWDDAAQLNEDIQSAATAATERAVAAESQLAEQHAAQKKLAGMYRSRFNRRDAALGRLRDTLPLTSEWSTCFEALLKRAPPEQEHLRSLWECQLRCLKSKSHRCRWHPAILRWCSDIWRQDRRAYEAVAFGGALILPHPDTVRKYSNTAVSQPGFNDACFSEIGEHVKLWDKKAREVILKFDEINTLAGLAWRKVSNLI
jgi:hypothetical protein